MLDLSNVVNISVSLTPVGLASFNVNNIALFSTDGVPGGWLTGQKFGEYVSAAAVGADFGTTTETYLQAVAIFSQQPNILAGGGSLIIIPFGNASTVSTATVNAGGTGYVVGDILSIVQTGGTGATIRVETVYAGAVVSISVQNVGYGYSVASGLTTTGGTGTGATINITGVTSETLEDAVLRGNGYLYFNGILSTNYGSNISWLALADSVQAYGDKMLFLPSNSLGDLGGLFTDIQQATDYATRCLYYGGSAQQARLFAAAYAAKLLSVNFTGSNTAITMNLKQLTTILPDNTVTQTVYNALKVAGVDAYVSYAGVPAVVSNGTNKYADEIANLVWLVTSLKVNGFNLLAQVGTKVPQTEAGVSLLKTAYRQVLEQGVTNGYIAAGKWTSAEFFGNQEDFINNIQQRGYYIYSQPVAQQSAVDREERKAPLIQIAVKEAGAIHSTNVIVSINP